MLKPIGNRILLEPKSLPEQINGILIPGSTKNTNLTGTVIAVGPGKKLANGTRLPTNVKVGDIIHYSSDNSKEITINGKKLITLTEDDAMVVYK
jgi:chaperonin GroES